MALSKEHKTKSSNNNESPEQQQKRVWSTVCAHNHQSCPMDSLSGDRKWPSYDAVMSDVANSDYNSTLTCPHDLHPTTTKNNSRSQDGKALCPFGVAICCKMQLFPCPNDQEPYTGLLTPDSTLESCIIRLSSAIQPPSADPSKSRLARILLLAAVGEKARNAKLFPTAAIKVFRSSSRHSGNVLFGGSKVGQSEDDYFAHAQCTQMTERMPRILKPFLRTFSKYSKHPLSLGISDFCQYNQDGQETSHLNFPFALVLSPRRNQQQTSSKTKASKTNKEEKDAFDVFLDDALNIPVGTILFDVFACPHPGLVSEPNKLQRIGQIMTCSQPVSSSPHDGLFFRHQRKEEDYQVRPEWKRYLKQKCTLDDGSTGTVEHLAGWELFEGHIAKGTFVDYEKVQPVNRSGA